LNEILEGTPISGETAKKVGYNLKSNKNKA
jgi:hypothetical protein